jgi:phospho-N-acetylmuramoyl-pentapeptide-transferase
MFYWLIFKNELVRGLLHDVGLWRFFYVFQYQTFRLMLAMATSFGLCMALAPWLIRVLRRLKVGGAVDFGHEVIDRFYASRAGTPTMGGILIVPAILFSTVLWARMDNFYVFLGLVTVLWLGALGGVDDYLKLVKKNRDGLRTGEKLVFQVALAMLLGYFLYVHGATTIRLPEGFGVGIALNLPFYKFPIPLPPLLFLVIAILVVAGSSNAVNLTDGMDGLAIGSMVPPTLVFLVMSYVAGRVDFSDYLYVPYVPGAGELAIFCGAIVGACLAFLWYNCSPAQVFMGDTGSLALGGAIGYVALATRQEVLLLMAGGVFVMEAMSVILQVGCYKLTHGRRIFMMSPIHHHFQLKGWTETQTVVRFWLIGAMFAALALASLKLR